MQRQENKRFAALVAGRMREKNLSLRALCRLSGMDPSLMSKILAGKRNPPDDDAVLREVARSLDLDPVELSVSVNRIPPEWRALGTSPELFSAVRVLLEGAGHAARTAPPAKPQPIADRQQGQMPEELL